MLNAVGKVFEILFETVRSLNLFELVVNSQPTNLRKQNSRPATAAVFGQSTRSNSTILLTGVESASDRSTSRRLFRLVSAAHLQFERERECLITSLKSALSKKPVERWENEGGKIETERKGTIKHNPKSEKGPKPPSQLRRTEKRKSR